MPHDVEPPVGRLEPASELLREPDPGPTPWLITDVYVDQALGAIVGPWKVTKTYATLDMTISITTGEPFLGREIPDAGPVVLVLEESGRAALWRRLDALCRGRAIDSPLAELRRPQAQLILEQRRQLRCHEVGGLTHRQPDPLVAEAAVPPHLDDGDVLVPVRDRPIGGVGLESHTSQPVIGGITIGTDDVFKG